MKTIEERAKEYVGAPCDDGCAICDASLCKLNEYSAFIEGARSEHEELTRWHNPTEELPDTNRDVLIKTTSLLQYRIAFYKANAQRNYHWHENNGAIDDDMVVGWRDIHE